jgi:hypothetical protein
MKHIINNLTVAHLVKVLGGFCLEPRISIRNRLWFVTWASWIQSAHKHTHIHTYTHTHTHTRTYIHTYTNTQFFFSKILSSVVTPYYLRHALACYPHGTQCLDVQVSAFRETRSVHWNVFFTQRIVVNSYRRFGTTCNSHSQHSWSLIMGPILCPETSVRNYHCAPRNIPEEGRSLLQRGRSLISRMVTAVLWCVRRFSWSQISCSPVHALLFQFPLCTSR